MKKIFAIAGATVLTAAASMAVEWGSVENLAAGSTVTVSSNEAAAATITDGDPGTSWQAIGKANKFAADWALIDLGEVKTFTDIEIIWEASHPTEYSVYLSDEAIPFAPQTFNVGTEEAPNEVSYNVIDSDWLASATVAATGGEVSESGFTETLSFDVAASARYVLIYGNAYNGFATDYGSRIFEVRIAKIQGRDEIASLRIADTAVTEGATAEITVEALTITGSVASIENVENLTLACSDPSAVEITAAEAGKFSVKGLKRGTYTLTVSGTVDGTEIQGQAQFTVKFNWTGIENIAAGKAATARILEDKDVTNPASFATDGDEETYYTYNGEWGGGDSWVIVDLGQVYLIEGAAQPAESDFKWTDNNALEGWTSTSSISRASNSVATYEPSEVIKARYVAVRDSDNPNGKPQVKEIYVAGTVYESPVASVLEVSATPDGLFAGETSQVSWTVKDQYGADFESAEAPVISVEGADYADGVITATAKGTVNITATLGELSATTSIIVADTNDYCMAGATVTSDNAAANGANAIDGGANPTAHGNQYVITESESAGEHIHWILADLHKPYNLDMIIAIWEGACPADYDVYVGETEETLEKFYSVTGHTQQTWYDRFCGKEMNNVRFIKIVTTRNATVYGIKLFDLKAYGHSEIESVATSVVIESDVNNISTDETVTFSGHVFDQFGAEMEGEQVLFEVDGTVLEGNTFTTEDLGIYQAYALSNNLISDPLVINVAAHKNNKVDAGAQKSTDSEYVSFPENGEIHFTELNQAAVITFDDEYHFNLIKLRWETACPSSYTVVAADKDGNTRTIFEIEDRPYSGRGEIDRIVPDRAESTSSQLRVSQASALNNIKSLTITPTAKNHSWDTIRLLGVDTYGAKVGTSTSVEDVVAASEEPVDVFNMQGVLLRKAVAPAEATNGLASGLYIVGGRKVSVR